MSVGTVTTGDPGTQAAVTNSGTENNAVLDFTIPQGAAGTNPPVQLLSAYSIPAQAGTTSTPLVFDRTGVSYGTAAEQGVGAYLGYLFFPALAIALPRAAMTVKMLRGSILGEMREDYIRTAYSKGNSKSGVLWRFALRNAMIPVITFLAMTIADIVAGSIVVEQVFAVQGIGQMLVSSISNRDYPVVQAIVALIALVVVVCNFAADLLYRVMDPRLRQR